MIKWMNYRWLYLLISGTVIISGMISLAKWGLNTSIEFKGGTQIEYKIAKDIDIKDFSSRLKSLGLQLVSVQKTSNGGYVFKLGEVSPDQRTEIQKGLESMYGEVKELRFETVGPAIGSELIKKTVYAMLLATFGILSWVAIQFKSIKYGISAVLAMLHDSLVTIGTYSLLGHFFGAEFDLLFVTALLTILSFSVHDTIVVYDRIRELKKGASLSIQELANTALTETMVRSLNNSFVVIFMMVSLLLLGGETIRWFIAALLIGTITGAYSSPFVAVPILVTWEELIQKSKTRKK